MISSLLVVDVAHIWWSAWHARSGIGDGPVDVSVSRLERLAEKLPASRVVVALDRPPYLRSEICPDYKSRRVQDSAGRDGLHNLIVRLRADGWTLAGVKGHEADDVCATLARLGKERGVSVTIATGDKDLWTLIGPHSLVDLDGNEVTAEQVVKRYCVRPDQLADALCIIGDKSDGIVGVDGIGEKRAGALFAAYGTLDGILSQEAWSPDFYRDQERARTKASKRATKAENDKDPDAATLRALADEASRNLAIARDLWAVHAHSEVVRLARELVRMRDDVPLDVEAIFGAQPAPKADDATPWGQEGGRSGEATGADEGGRERGRGTTRGVLSRGDSDSRGARTGDPSGSLQRGETDRDALHDAGSEAPERAFKAQDDVTCAHPDDERCPLSGDDWQCGACGEIVPAPWMPHAFAADCERCNGACRGYWCSVCEDGGEPCSCNEGVANGPTGDPRKVVANGEREADQRSGPGESPDADSGGGKSNAGSGSIDQDQGSWANFGGVKPRGDRGNDLQQALLLPESRGGNVSARVYNFSANDATRESILLRAGFCGPTGSGKTKTALIIGSRMVERLGLGPLFVIDSENKSALRYAYSPRSKQGYRFKHVPMPEDDYSPAAYMAALDYVEAQGAGVVVIDSLSHAWNGINGVLEQVDQVTERSRSKNTFSEGWKTMTPIQNRLIQRILGSSAHVIFTMRAKTDWIVQENERGKREPMKVGLAPVQREGVDYEPDLFFDMTVPDNGLIVSKSRCDRLVPGEVVKRPNVAFADVLIEWIEDSEPSTVARTLGEALNLAVAAGMKAWQDKSADDYKTARRDLLAWCDRAGVGEARRNVALEQFKERVAAVASPKPAEQGAA